ncbi:MAG: membrane protein insertion efficiency factor YidD [Aeriscardovia sp.]|nr:membrane protein insertion efficiency factor YidD [Aeriscardovia sp.]
MKDSPAARAACAAIAFYRRFISPLSGPKCKFYPSCSMYAVIAVRRFGAFKGLLLAALRLLRCNPWSDGGIDDVPRKFSLFYRFRWSKAHEEPTLQPIVTMENQMRPTERSKA